MKEYQYSAKFYDPLLFPFIRPIRNKVIALVKRYNYKSILDVCCGTGDQLKLLKQHGFESEGIDLSDAMLSVAGKGEHKADCMHQDATHMHYEDAKKFDGMILWWANTSGPKAIPGSYTVKLKMENDSIIQNFQILKDPRITSSQEDLAYQFDFLMDIRDKITEAHEAIIDIRNVKAQLAGLKERLDDDKHQELIKNIETMEEKISSVEKNLYQTKNKSNQDPLNYPIKLTNKLGHIAALNSSGTFRPTQQEEELKKELFEKVDAELAIFINVKNEGLPLLNKQVLENKIPFIELDKDEE